MKEPKDFTQQAARIRNKLAAARQADPDLRVFGARAHKYLLGSPISPVRLAELEAEYGIELPADFRAFLTLVGNGSGTHKMGNQRGAGPHYGIYEAEQVLKLANMSAPPLFSPNTTEAEWKALKAQVSVDAIPYEDLTHGTVCIADQGCSTLNLLVLCGPETGRIVNYDEGEAPPKFAFESNFLNWYERWLDEILAGYLLTSGPYWFGYTMGGDDHVLLAAYEAAQTSAEKLAAISGFFKLIKIAPESTDRLIDIVRAEAGEIHQRAIEALATYAPEAAQPFLEALIKDKHANIRSLCYFLGRATPDFVAAFKASLLERLATCSEHESYFSVLSLLNHHKLLKPEEILPFLSHKDPVFRSSAIYFLGLSTNRSAYAGEFAAALRDDDPIVIRNALQAIKGMDDPRLHAEFPHVRTRFKEEKSADQTYILPNLAHVEKDMLGLKTRVKRLFKR